MPKNSRGRPNCRQGSAAPPVGLAQDRDAKPGRLENSPQDAHRECRMIDIGVSGHEDDIDLIPAPRRPSRPAMPASAAASAERPASTGSCVARLASPGREEQIAEVVGSRGMRFRIAESKGKPGQQLRQSFIMARRSTWAQGRGALATGRSGGKPWPRAGANRGSHSSRHSGGTASGSLPVRVACNLRDFHWALDRKRIAHTIDCMKGLESRDERAGNRPMLSGQAWTFLSNHAHVLLCIAQAEVRLATWRIESGSRSRRCSESLPTWRREAICRGRGRAGQPLRTARGPAASPLDGGPSRGGGAPRLDSWGPGNRARSRPAELTRRVAASQAEPAPTRLGGERPLRLVYPTVISARSCSPEKNGAPREVRLPGVLGAAWPVMRMWPCSSLTTRSRMLPWVAWRTWVSTCSMRVITTALPSQRCDMISFT